MQQKPFDDLKDYTTIGNGKPLLAGFNMGNNEIYLWKFSENSVPRLVRKPLDFSGATEEQTLKFLESNDARSALVCVHLNFTPLNNRGLDRFLSQTPKLAIKFPALVCITQPGNCRYINDTNPEYYAKVALNNLDERKLFTQIGIQAASPKR